MAIAREGRPSDAMSCGPVSLKATLAPCSSTRVWPRRRLAILVALAIACASAAAHTATSFAGMALQTAYPRHQGAFLGVPAQRPGGRSVGVERQAYVRKSHRIKKAQNIALMRRLGPRGLTNKKLKKKLRDVRKVAEDDAWTDEFLSYNQEKPIGGEYLMPVEMVRDILKDIYGEGPTLKNLNLDKEKVDPTPITPDDLDGLEKIRRKMDQSRRPVPGASKVNTRELMLPNMLRGLGTLPKEVLTNCGSLGVQGGSKDMSTQDVWLGGASVAYDFEN
mmetsp:Transcript_29790/g.81711  ORF Transcript_29790/g.81711 Transcript_29790/m.81711 type:complete len:277 (-) Transcript_29790:117-947(-)